MDGPSLPSGMPQVKDKRLPAISAPAVRNHLTRKMPRAQPSASGIPLPLAERLHNRRQQTAHYGKRNYAHYCERGFCRFVHAERKRYNNLGARQKQRNYSAARYACGATVQ